MSSFRELVLVYRLVLFVMLDFSLSLAGLIYILYILLVVVVARFG